MAIPEFIIVSWSKNCTKKLCTTRNYLTLILTENSSHVCASCDVLLGLVFTMKKIVLTGGPCAGKTTIAEVLSRAFAGHISVVPESASLLFRGGFPRWKENQQPLQKAIYEVQRQLEDSYSLHHPTRVLVLDRGTIDGAAYWPQGAESFFQVMGSSLEKELDRYSEVIYLESAGEAEYEAHKKKNHYRTETWEEAKRLDDKTYKIWQRHPLLHTIENHLAFHEKIHHVITIVEKSLKGDS